MKTDNITLIVPIKIDSKDRERNLSTTLAFNLKHYNFKIIIKEVDSERKYYNELLNDPRVTYIFEQSNLDYFHRTKILNDMLLMVDTEYVANYDCDMLIPINTMQEVVKMIEQKTDLIFAYKKGTFLTGVPNNSEDMNHIIRTLDNSFVESIIKKFNRVDNKGGLALYQKMGLGTIWTAGGVQFFNTQSYKNGYGENEQFLDWGPEDQERLFRFAMLGYNIKWLPHESSANGVLHLDHENSQAVSKHNQYNRKNHNLWRHITGVYTTKQKLINYMNSLSYITRLK